MKIRIIVEGTPLAATLDDASASAENAMSSPILGKQDRSGDCYGLCYGLRAARRIIPLHEVRHAREFS